MLGPRCASRYAPIVPRRVNRAWRSAPRQRVTCGCKQAYEPAYRRKLDVTRSKFPVGNIPVVVTLIRTDILHLIMLYSKILHLIIARRPRRYPRTPVLHSPHICMCHTYRSSCQFIGNEPLKMIMSTERIYQKEAALPVLPGESVFQGGLCT